MQQHQSITDRPPKPSTLPPRKSIRDLREEALRISSLVQSAVGCAAIGAALAAIILRANSVGMAICIPLMMLSAANAMFVQSTLSAGELSPLYVLSRTMKRSPSRTIRAMGRMLRNACAALPLWAGGTATVQRLRMVKPYRLQAHHEGANVEVVRAPVESKRGEDLSPIASTIVALGTSVYAAPARQRIEAESARAEAVKDPTEDDELWIAAGAMLRVLLSLEMTTDELAHVQSSIAKWMSGLMSPWTIEKPVGFVLISPDDAWRMERFGSSSLAFIAVAGNYGANVGKADVAIRILYHRVNGHTGAPVIEFASVHDTEPPNAIVQGVDQEAETPTSPPPSRLADLHLHAEPLQ
jgi:hypothetical protein